MSVQPLKLPPEVDLHIFSLLDYKSLKAVRQVCKTWQLFLEERSLWKDFVKIEELSNKEINRNILNWKNFANRVLREGTIADIICFIDMLKTHNRNYPSRNVWNMSVGQVELEYKNRNILNWKNLANCVLKEGTIADIICFINMIKARNKYYSSCCLGTMSVKVVSILTSYIL